LKLVHWVQDALKTKEETQVPAATSSEGAKEKFETANPQLYVNNVAE
jgi:hypothetical protein